MSIIDDATAIVQRTFRSNATKVNLIRRVRDIGSGDHPDDPFEVFYLAVLSLVQSGQRRQSEVRPVRRWLVRHGYARLAGEFSIPDFRHDGRDWVVANHPMNLEAIR